MIITCCWVNALLAFYSHCCCLCWGSVASSSTVCLKVCLIISVGSSRALVWFIKQHEIMFKIEYDVDSPLFKTAA